MRSLLTPFARSLNGRLDRLQGTLDGLGEQLREAIARAIGRTVGDAVREAVQAILADAAAGPEGSARPLEHFGRPRSFWDESEQASWQRAEAYDEPDRGTWPDAADEREEFEPAALPTRQYGAPLNRALAVGCQAASFWLRRRRGRFSLLGALGVGLAAGLATFAPGHLIAGGVGVALSVLNLLTLSGTRSGG